MNPNILIMWAKKEWRIQGPVFIEFLLGFGILSGLWMFFRNQSGVISLPGVLSWCIRPHPFLYFSLFFVFSSTCLVLIVAVITSVIEIFSPTGREIIRWGFVLINCLPVYFFTDLFRYLYGYESKPEFASYLFYGLAALISGNVIWLFVHKYFVENLRKEMNLPHMETASALGLKRLGYVWPRTRLMVLDVIRPLSLILMGTAIFVENRFRYRSSGAYEFEGMSYHFFYDLTQKPDHDFEMILGIIFTVLLINFGLQTIIAHARYLIDPELRYDR